MLSDSVGFVNDCGCPVVGVKTYSSYRFLRHCRYLSPASLSLSSLWPMAYPMAIDNIYMKYIFASDPIENGGSPSPVPVIDTGLLRGVMMNQNQQLGFPRIITTNTSERPALARAPACCMLWSYEFCLVISLQHLSGFYPILCSVFP